MELNRAVAGAMAFGPAAGLALVDLLAKLERWDEARADFERAATLTRNLRERTLLERRAAACAREAAPGAKEVRS